jgi:hypothetical protein
MRKKLVMLGDNFRFQNLVCLTIVCIIQNMDISDLITQPIYLHVLAVENVHGATP